MKEINKIQLNTEEYIIEPPIANETIQGGILAKQKTNESVPVKIRDGKCFIPEYPNGDSKIDIAQSAQNKDKVLVVNNSGELEATEYKASNDNTLFGHVDKILNPSINDSFQRELQNLKLHGKSTQVKTTGKNLFDINKSKKGLYLNSQGIEVVYDEEFSVSDYIEIAQSGKICINPLSESSVAYVCFYNQEKALLNNYTNSSVITKKGVIDIPEDAKYIRFSSRNIELIQVEYGLAATAYEPYTGGKPSPSPEYKQPITYISEFSGQVNNGGEQSQPFLYTPTKKMYSVLDGSISDFVDIQNGKEVYNMSGEFVFDGSEDENWEKAFAFGNTKTIRFRINVTMEPYPIRPNGMCNNNTFYLDGLNADLPNCGLSGYYFYYTINKSEIPNYSTISDFKEWLKTHNIVVVYQLATPTEIPIDAEKLAELRKLYTYTGTTNFLCNSPVSFDYEKSVQIVIDNIKKQIDSANANILMGG